MIKKFSLFLLLVTSICQGQDFSEMNALPVQGLCIAAPDPSGIDSFIGFINNDLTKRKVNTLVLRVDYNYSYTSYPNLRSQNPLSQNDVKRLVNACQKNNICLVPQFNLLGHQSWQTSLGKLLSEYPEFDETPHIKLPEKYEWPNEDGLYCKSYCPRHPEVHQVVFALIDELMEVFEADAFHAGMDEVFYIGDNQCPRCSGRDKAELFAEEVRLIHDHLGKTGKELWIWGDRLLDGETTGLGEWEASTNNTHRAIDLIPKDIVIWDWHYERAEPTAAYFAMKGFRVVSCCWNKPEVAKAQVELISILKESANAKISSNILGVAQTIWNSPSQFMDLVLNPQMASSNMGPVNSYRTLFEELDKRIK